MAPSPGQRRTLPPSAAVLCRQQPPNGRAAAAEAVGDGLLCQASAAPAAGPLLAGLAGPEQDQQGEQDQRQQQSGASGDGCHWWWLCVLAYCSTAEPRGAALL